MPTTDPGSDIHFSTDDELGGEAANHCGGGGANDGFGTVPRTRRYLLQSELQRRYIEEIGDGTDILKRMPPELIVTSPTKPSGKAAGGPPSYKPPTTAPTSDKRQTSGEFPMIGGSGSGAGSGARRTNSWHNLHNSGKCLPKYRVQNPYQMGNGHEGSNYYHSNYKEDLQLKLSLKKKIWTGVTPEPATYVERNRPLSWGLPPRTMGGNGGAGMLKSEKVVTLTRSKKKDENEALLTACSQKLLAWQQQDSGTAGSNQRSKLMLNLVVPEINTEEQTLRIFQQLTRTKRLLKVSASKVDQGDGRPNRKKKNPLSKIAETTQILTRLSKAKARGSHVSLQRLKATNTNGPAPLPGAPKSVSISSSNNYNRFKTGGLVATAVQPNARKIKKLRAITTANTNTNSSGSKAQPMEATSTTAKASSVSSNFKTALETTTFVRQVKTKLKKKKAGASSKTAVGAGVAAEGDVAAEVPVANSQEKKPSKAGVAVETRN